MDLGVELHAPRALAVAERLGGAAGAAQELDGAGGGSMPSSFQCSAIAPSGSEPITGSPAAAGSGSIGVHSDERPRQADDAPAERMGQQLGAEADAEHRDPALDRLAQYAASAVSIGSLSMSRTDCSPPSDTTPSIPSRSGSGSPSRRWISRSSTPGGPQRSASPAWPVNASSRLCRTGDDGRLIGRGYRRGFGFPHLD